MAWYSLDSGIHQVLIVEMDVFFTQSCIDIRRFI